jgi:hypothetical protein
MVGISSLEQDFALLGSLIFSLMVVLTCISLKSLSLIKRTFIALPALIVLAIGSCIALASPNNSKWLSTFAAVFGFFSFHFLYSDGWSFDGAWSKWREIRERLYPAKEDRNEGWWHGTTGYFCAVLATVFWIWAAWRAK